MNGIRILLAGYTESTSLGLVIQVPCKCGLMLMFVNNDFSNSLPFGMQKNKDLITQFYTAFQKGDFATMQKSYHDDARFNDPAFQGLNASEVRAMWQMLVTAAKDLRITFSDVEADDVKGSCMWEARYTFSKTGRSVHNIIEANFEFKEGKIVKHNDHFSFWRWSRQALGTSGLLLGWSNMLQQKVQTTARKGLEVFMRRRSA